MTAQLPSGDCVVLHIPSGTYLRLRGSARTILDLLAEHGTVEGAATVLADRFAIPPARASADVTLLADAIAGLRRTKSRPVRTPTLRGARSVVADWRALSLPSRWAVAKAVSVLLAVEIGLRVADLRTLAQWLRTPLSDVGYEADVASHEASLPSTRERTMLWALNWALARWLVQDTCLRRALSMGFFLRRRHPTLRIGLLADGRAAHAWIEAEGATYDMGDGVGVVFETSH